MVYGWGKEGGQAPRPASPRHGLRLPVRCTKVRGDAQGGQACATADGLLADQLKLHGVRRVFSVPGESFLAALDGLHESGIGNVVCRQEGGAAMMAEAQGKMTGEPGICFVTRGPGATNAAAGVHVARQDSTPMILFIGQIDRGHRDREAFQEVDFRAMFGPLAKWAAEIDATERIPEYVARAFRVAVSGRPGPVVLSLPEDVLNAEAEVPDRPPAGPRLAPDWSGAAREAMEMLRGAERPLVVVGGSQWSEEAAADLGRFAEAQGLPVAAGFRRQDHIDNRHPNYVGDLNVGVNPRLAKRLRESDARRPPASQRGSGGRCPGRTAHGTVARSWCGRTRAAAARPPVYQPSVGYERPGNATAGLSRASPPTRLGWRRPSPSRCGRPASCRPRVRARRAARRASRARSRRASARRRLRGPALTPAGPRDRPAGVRAGP